MANPDQTEQANAAPSPDTEMQTIWLGGRGTGLPLRIPAAAPPEAIKKAIEYAKTTPQFDAIIDKQTGAPSRVRSAVGGAQPPDRLGTLRNFYPDAQPYEDDNFIYTDPESGRIRMYNPKGVDTGDVASLSRVGVQMVGGTVGAIGGAVATPLTPMVGSAVGAGAGSALAGHLHDVAMTEMLGAEDSRSVTKRVLDTAFEFGAGAVGQRIGEGVTPFFKEVFAKLKPGAQHLVEAFQRAGIDPPAGVATGNRGLTALEHTLRSNNMSAQRMADAADKVLNQTNAAADKLTRKFGEPKTVAGAGETIRDAAVRAAEKFKFTQEEAYQKAFDAIGDDTLVHPAAVEALRRTMIQEMAKSPKTLSQTMQPAINTLQSIVDDAADTGGIPIKVIREIRTNIGRDIGQPAGLGLSASSNQQMRRVYAALSEDVSETAKLAGPEAKAAIAAADRYTRAFINTTGKTLEKINKFDADEKAFKYVMTATRDGHQQLARLRRSFSDEEWDTVSSSVLDHMGRATPGAATAESRFSVNTFLTNYKRMTPEAKKVLFGGSRYSELQDPLDDLVRISASLKEFEKLSNTSNTAQNVVGYFNFSALAAATGMFLSGYTVPGAGLAATVLAPKAGAKLITNPNFVKWLVTPVTKPNGLNAHLSRLTAIYASNPGIRDEIRQYASVLRGVNVPVPYEPRPAGAGSDDISGGTIVGPSGQNVNVPQSSTTANP